MNDQFDENIRDLFRSSDQPNLPSNFSWIVMRRIQEARISRARYRAQLEALVIGFVAIACAVVLLAGYRFYVSAPVSVSMSVAELPLPAMVSALVLFGLWLLDTALRARST